MIVNLWSIKANAFEPKEKSSLHDGREPPSDLPCLRLHLCNLGIHLFGDPVRRGNYSAALRCRLPASDCRWIAIWMVLVNTKQPTNPDSGHQNNLNWRLVRVRMGRLR